MIALTLAPRAVDWQDLIRYDRELGWKPKPNLRVHASDQAQNPFRVTTDEHGWRGRDPGDAADVLVFGDSFAFGNGIDDGSFFAGVVHRPRIKAIGAPGYNLVQSFRLMRSMAPTLRGKLAVWFVYLGNDLEDTLQPSMGGYRAPFLRFTDGGWEIEDQHIDDSLFPIVGERTNYEGFIEICRPGSFLGDRAFSAFEHLLIKAHTLCDAAGAKLVVLSIPDLSKLVERQIHGVLSQSEIANFDADWPDRVLAEICARQAVRFVPLKRHLEPAHYLADDVHWNAGGHREVANLLSRLWQDSGGDGVAPRSIESIWRQRSFADETTSAAVGDR